MSTGGLAPSSVFSYVEEEPKKREMFGHEPEEKFKRLADRNLNNISMALNPRPKARNRWLRKMVIRHVRKGGRLTRAETIARTERSHLSRSHFMKTSIKKMMMLARQIAGKSIDEAILQMRFSKKRVAQQVLQQLVVARNEAIVSKGMGLSRGPANAAGEDLEIISATPLAQDSNNTASRENQTLQTLPNGPLVQDPSTTPPLASQTPTKTLKKTQQAHPTDIYIAESWINRGPYGKQAEYRARGRMNIRRPPHTGISVLLKEEKTRTREKKDKEARAIRRRLGKGAWVQLPDRPVTRQSQQVLW